MEGGLNGQYEFDLDLGQCIINPTSIFEMPEADMDMLMGTSWKMAMGGEDEDGGDSSASSLDTSFEINNSNNTSNTSTPDHTFCNDEFEIVSISDDEEEAEEEKQKPVKDDRNNNRKMKMEMEKEKERKMHEELLLESRYLDFEDVKKCFLNIANYKPVDPKEQYMIPPMAEKVYYEFCMALDSENKKAEAYQALIEKHFLNKKNVDVDGLAQAIFGHVDPKVGANLLMLAIAKDHKKEDHENAERIIWNILDNFNIFKPTLIVGRVNSLSLAIYFRRSDAVLGRLVRLGCEYIHSPQSVYSPFTVSIYCVQKTLERIEILNTRTHKPALGDQKVRAMLEMRLDDYLRICERFAVNLLNRMKAGNLKTQNNWMAFDLACVINSGQLIEMVMPFKSIVKIRDVYQEISCLSLARQNKNQGLIEYISNIQNPPVPKPIKRGRRAKSKSKSKTKK